MNTLTHAAGRRTVATPDLHGTVDACGRKISRLMTCQVQGQSNTLTRSSARSKRHPGDTKRIPFYLHGSCFVLRAASRAQPNLSFAASRPREDTRSSPFALALARSRAACTVSMATFDGDKEVCPLCCENLEDADKAFEPCPCGYQVRLPAAATTNTEPWIVGTSCCCTLAAASLQPHGRMRAAWRHFCGDLHGPAPRQHGRARPAMRCVEPLAFPVPTSSCLLDPCRCRMPLPSSWLCSEPRVASPALPPPLTGLHVLLATNPRHRRQQMPRMPAYVL